MRHGIYSNPLSRLSSSTSVVSTKYQTSPQIQTTIPNILIHPEITTPRILNEFNHRGSVGFETSMELRKHFSGESVDQAYISRSPSPAISSGSSVLHSQSQSSYEDKGTNVSHLRDPAISIETNKSDSDEEIQTPVEPSAKALGKRRMVAGRVYLSESYIHALATSNKFKMFLR